jgi:hypothetical protein
MSTLSLSHMFTRTQIYTHTHTNTHTHIYSHTHILTHTHTTHTNTQAVGWIVGFINQDFLLTFYYWLFGLCVSVILCVPDWGIYNRNPVKWLDKIGGK